MINMHDCIGLDNGNGDVKGANGEGRVVVFPAQVARVANPGLLGGGGGFGHCSYRDESGAYLIGEDAVLYGQPEVRSIDSRYIRLDAYRIQALYMLEQLGAKRPHIVTGLPVEFFEADREPLRELMLGWRHPEIAIQAVEVYPQPIGTIVDLSFDWGGKRLKNLRDCKVPVIDIGRGTLDAMEIVNMKPTEVRAGKTKGVSLIHQALYDYIVSRFKPGQSIRPADMDRFLRQGYFDYDGKPQDLSRPIKRGKETLLQAVEALLVELWGNIKALRHVIVTGGGAQVLREELLRIIPAGQLLIPENPAQSNAIGFSKLQVIRSRSQ